MKCEGLTTSCCEDNKGIASSRANVMAYTVPSDCSSQQNKMRMSTRRDYSVSTVHIQCFFSFLFACIYKACTSCLKPLHTVAPLYFALVL